MRTRHCATRAVRRLTSTRTQLGKLASLADEPLAGGRSCVLVRRAIAAGFWDVVKQPCVVGKARGSAEYAHRHATEQSPTAIGTHPRGVLTFARYEVCTRNGEGEIIAIGDCTSRRT